MSALSWKNVDAVPIVHGRIPFAIAVREHLLARRYDALLVQLPASLESFVLDGVSRLPRLHVVYWGQGYDPAGQGPPPAWYVPIDPGDGMIEALRVARLERTRVHFVDAEVPRYESRPLVLPDAHALLGLGLERWYAAAAPGAILQTRTAQDVVREHHVAARVADVSARLGEGRRALLVCELGHWEGIHRHLDSGYGRLSDAEGPPPEAIRIEAVHPRSLPHVVGEIPFVLWRYEKHRSGVDPEPFDPVSVIPDLLLKTRDAYERSFADSLERATPSALRILLGYARKLTLVGRRLAPSLWDLATAAKGVIGNDFAVTLIDTAHRYPPNGSDDGVLMTPSSISVDDAPARAILRTPGEMRTLGRLSLRRRPSRKDAARWRRGWNPYDHCSWPPEDVVIENFRDYVSKRALTLAGVGLRKTEPFLTSFKDGLALRETLRDWHRGQVHVKEEPRVAGAVGALVLVFEEDDDGTKFPWRSTWMAEHEAESTLAYYATDPRAEMVGPGIGRLYYGGCLFLFPPIAIPDVWDDLRFERARRPSERLLLAAIFWSQDRHVVYVSGTPPSPELKAEAALLNRHLVYLPLSSFSASTLERLRRAHVLNGKEVRSWADRFIG